MIQVVIATYRKIYTERKNLSAFAALNLISLASSFILMIAFANLLDKSALGTYQYVVSIVSIAGAFSLYGLGPAFIKAIGRKEYGFIHYGQKQAFWWSALPISTALAIGAYYIYNGDSVIGYSVMLSTVALVITQYFNRFIFILNGIELFVKSNLIQIAQNISPIIILLPFLFFTDSPLILSLGYFLSAAIATYVMCVYLKVNTIVEQFKSSTQNARVNALHLKFAIHQSAIYALNVLSVHLDKVLLFQILGAQQTANYVLAVTVPNKIKSLIKQFEPYVFSKFAKHSIQSARLQLTSKFLLGLVLCLPLFLAYALSAEFIFKFLLPKYTDLINISILYALVIFSGIIFIPHSILRIHASNTTFYVVTFLSTFIQLSLIGWGAISWGVTGALIGKMAGSIINMFVAFIIALFTVNKTPNDNDPIDVDELGYRDWN